MSIKALENFSLNVLGTLYSVFYKDEQTDKFLKECDGYTDKTTKQIVISTEPKDNQLGNWDEYRKKVLRHEIIHAFLFESGLHGQANYDAQNGQEHPEMMVDWFAAQWHKLAEAFKNADAI